MLWQLLRSILYPLRNHLCDSYTDTLKVFINLLIGKPNYFQSISIKNHRTLQIIRFSLRRIMLRAVYFDDEPRSKTVKIRNKR